MIISMRFPMTSLRRDRKIMIYLPDDYYYHNKRYPVMYINDGQNAFFDQQSYIGVSWGFLEYVQEIKLDIIMVAIPCNFHGFKRMDEYGPWVINNELSLQETNIKGKRIGGEGVQYVEWLKDELKPYIDQHFTTDPEDCAIIGSSMGAVISAYATLQYPEVFKKCAALSTAFWFYMQEFEEVIETHQYGEDVKFYFDLGEFEGCGDQQMDEWYIETNNIIYEKLKGKIKNLDYRFFEGAVHNESEWRQRVPLFMKFFYEGKDYV